MKLFNGNQANNTHLYTHIRVPGVAVFCTHTGTRCSTIQYIMHITCIQAPGVPQYSI